MNIFLPLFLILTPIVSFITIYLRKWKYKQHFELVEVIIMFILIFISLREDAEPHYLLGMTTLQQFILLSVGMTYVEEITDYILSMKEEHREITLKEIVMHAAPGYIGILYMFCVKQCGGIIVRLLLDSVTLLMSLLQQLFFKKYNDLMEDLYIIVFILSRVIYYSFLSVYGIYIMILHWSYIDKILFLM